MTPPLSQPSTTSAAGLRTADFDRIYRAPERQRRSSWFRVLARPNRLGRNRWGISVQARLGNAVLRNRVKRRVREILRRAQERLPAGWDVVVQPRSRRIATREFHLLATELEELLKKTLAERTEP